MSRQRLVAIPFVMAVMLLSAGCAEQTPSVEPCLGEEPVAVTLQRQRFVIVSHEAEAGLELARFGFERASVGGGPITVTAEPAVAGQYIEASTGEPVSVAGDRLTSIRIRGLVGGAASDRIQSSITEPHAIREIVQVRDAHDARWIIGTAAGSCLRLRANEDAGLVVLAVTPP